MDERGLLHGARDWAHMDPDPDTKAEVLRHVLDEDIDWLAEHFAAPLAFGTAGIRGPLGPGAARMNRLQVCLLAKAMADTMEIGRVEGPVVVAHDARPESPGLARDIVTVLRRSRRDVIACRGPVATPVASWVAREHEAPAAIVVTASHNPIGDAGVKVFGPEGAQIIPPQDARIRTAMEATTSMSGLIDTAPPDLVEEPATAEVGGLVVIEDAHLDYEECVLLRHTSVSAAGMVIATSALHGVAGGSVVRLLEAAGHTVHPVADQQEPDGTFPTIGNPNPEDPRTLERLLAEADGRGADLALANDPDGDRLAVAVPDADGWRILSGNEIGILLTDDLLTDPGRSLLVTTVVSTPLVEDLARGRRALFVKTWTGFKWIAAAIEWAQRTRGAEPALGFEEALGFCVGDLVRDKDGIRAAMVVADMAASLRDRRRSLLDRLEELQQDHGVWVSATRTVGVDAVAAERAIDRLLSSPPTRMDGRDVEQVIDHRQPVTDELLYPELPPTLMAEVRATGARLLLRPSGTEPILKLYAHVHARAEGDVPRVTAELELRARALLQWACDALGLVDESG